MCTSADPSSATHAHARRAREEKEPQARRVRDVLPDCPPRACKRAARCAWVGLVWRIHISMCRASPREEPYCVGARAKGRACRATFALEGKEQASRRSVLKRDCEGAPRPMNATSRHVGTVLCALPCREPHEVRQQPRRARHNFFDASLQPCGRRVAQRGRAILLWCAPPRSSGASNPA